MMAEPEQIFHLSAVGPTCDFLYFLWLVSYIYTTQANLSLDQVLPCVGYSGQ